eukprot:5155868-Prymnesium_polylepis.2
MSSCATTGADDDADAKKSDGYFSRANDASIPGYDPPKVSHRLSPRPYAPTAYAWNVARSARAWREESHFSGFESVVV